MKSMLIGLAIGDAFGAPFEFKRKGTYVVSNDYETGGAHNVSKGEWTDDTSMALCLANSLIENNGYNEIDIMNKWILWFKTGYMSTRNHCFDIGGQTSYALNHFIRYKKLLTGESYNAGGNGTIMRLAPIAEYFDSIEEVEKYSFKSALLTHNMKENADISELFGKILFLIKKGKTKEEIKEIIPKGFFDWNVSPTGYVVNTLKVALKGFFQFDSFLDGLKYVVSLGEDTDTVGAVYGSMAGAYYDIPEYLINELQQKDLIIEIDSKLKKLI